MQSALDAVGGHYKDFLITKYLPLPELQSTLVELVHVPTGARVLHIGNDDTENVFCLSFQTLPTSSNGVAHILEHTVLCGSKKYPVKDPFFAMTRRSLHTFMNAFTGQDFTCYPASSQVKKDYYNLLEVYLDAVFHPELKRLSFLQEGHRIEFTDPKDPESPLQFQGVVYNEMKGAMMSSDSRLGRSLGKHLTPDLPYSHNSGGEPKEIPNLSYEELIEFHRAFYHPSRCLFYFYGNLPLTEQLDFIEERALRGVAKLGLLPPLPLQHRFTAPFHATEYYPIAASEDPTEKSEIAFSWLTAHISQQSDALALCLIDIFLMETDVSFLKLALLKSKLCREAESSIDVEMSELPLTIVCKGCKSENALKLQKVLFKALTDLVAKPLDQERVEAAVHQLEFQRTEITAEGGPFGLHLFLRAGLIKQHGNEPEGALQIQTLFAELRQRLKNPKYLPGLIKHYLIDNPHFVVLTLKPDPELEKKELEEERHRLEAIRKKLTGAEKEAIAAQSAQLLKYQESAEHQSLECLPKVTLKDIPPHARDFPLRHADTPAFDLYHHDCFTNQIIYADLLFDLPEIDEEDLPLLSLLSKVWTELGAGGKSYEETLQFMESNTGEFDAHLALHVCADKPDLLLPAFSLRGKALMRKAEGFFQLLTDYSHGPDCSDHARIREWLLQHMTELDENLANNPLNYAIQLSLCSYSTASFIYNQWNGFAYYRFVKKLVEDKSNRWIERLDKLAKKIVENGKPHLILSCDKKQAEELHARQYYALGKRRASFAKSPWKGNYKNESIPSQARIISAPVAFTALGMRTSAYRDPHVAELMILTELLGNVILHKEVREKGGAYGSGASYAPTTGNFHFYSYRDPNLSRTLDVFKESLEKMARGEFNERELEEAKIGLIGSIDTPVPPSGRAIVSYAWLRSRRTLAARQKLREQILSATKEQIMRAVEQCLLNHPSTTVSLLGQQIWDKEEQKAPLQLAPLYSARD